ncbi:MFS transporter [Hoeflea prorocentri]|uniref:MFS transporter n=1 Tax=Hoeflea prorocentri TaxID=1922333 RepID=A0A9X3UGS8_9HYPH|nr:MFS transporter [Hoeflea prorocentri]MCY6380543.1 MFS transporter [Hoeflea prorocentri]MDA5398343.1 MFS transporter [Hoeflea prorocentri]
MAGIAALAAAYIFSQFYRSFLAVLTPVLIEELGAGKADLSVASGIWFLTFALMQFVVGISLDRFGPRRTAAFLFAAGTGGGALLFAIATTPLEIIIAMAMIGIGCSPVLMAAFFIFAHHFPAARFAIASSWFVALGTAGNVIGAKPLAIAVESFGWRETMLGLGLVSLLTALAIYRFVKDPEIERTDAPDSGLSGYWALLKMPALWLIIPLIAVNYAPAAGVRGLWAGPYLADVFGASTQLIGTVTLFMAISMIIGSVIYGPLDTLFKTRKWVAFVGNCGGAIALFALALYPIQPIWQVTVLLFAVGLCGASYGVLMAHARAYFPKHLTGRGVTLMNFFTIGGVGFFQFITGQMAEASYNPAMPEETYSLLFGTYAVLLTVTVIIYLFSTDRKPD